MKFLSRIFNNRQTPSNQISDSSNFKNLNPNEVDRYGCIFKLVGVPLISNGIAQSLIQPLNVVRIISQGTNQTRVTEILSSVKTFKLKHWTSGMGANLVRSSFTTGVPLIVKNAFQGDNGKIIGSAVNIGANLVMEPIQLHIIYKNIASKKFPYIEKGLWGRTQRAIPFYLIRDGSYSYALLSSPKNRYIDIGLPFLVGWLTSAPDQVIKQMTYSNHGKVTDIFKSNLKLSSLCLPGPVLRSVVVGVSVTLTKEIYSLLQRFDGRNDNLNESSTNALEEKEF